MKSKQSTREYKKFPPEAWVFVVSKDQKTKRQNAGQSRQETSTDEVQTEHKRTLKKVPVGAKFSAPFQTGPGTRPGYTCSFSRM
jgi:hypothetical protein